MNFPEMYSMCLKFYWRKGFKQNYVRGGRKLGWFEHIQRKKRKGNPKTIMLKVGVLLEKKKKRKKNQSVQSLLDKSSFPL